MTDKLRQEAKEAAIDHGMWLAPDDDETNAESFVAGYFRGWSDKGVEIEKADLAAATAREKEIEELRAEVNDWRESARKAIQEPCGDELHCSCVGSLRHQVVRQAQRIVECEEEVIHRGRLNQLAISLAEEFERAVASRNPVGGMSVPPSGDFISCAQLPSAVKRMEWWARAIRREQAQLEGGE